MDNGGQPKILFTRKRTTKNKKPIFHGAFTGGFSAGYYNTVGSKDGWAPVQTIRKEQSIQDYMDDDDHNEWGGPQRIQNKYSVQKKDDHKKQQQQQEKVVTTTGNELLRILGWRQSTGQAYVTIQVKNNHKTTDEKHDDDDDDCNIRRISFPSTIILPPLKCDTFGIGYSPPINNEIKPFLLSSSTKKETSYYKMNFDDDPKEEENKEDYNFEIIDDFSSSDDDEKSLYPNNTTATIKNKNTQSLQKSVISDSLGQWAKVEVGKETNNNFQKKNKTNIISGFIHATGELPKQQRWSGPNVPINYQVQKHQYTQQNTKLNYPHPPQPSRMFAKVPDQIFNRKSQQPMAGPTFVSLVDSMKRRFTKSSTTVNDDIQEKETSTKTEPFGCKRYSQTWMPSALLCKRFSIQLPIMSKDYNKAKIGNLDSSDTRSEWKNEDAFFQREIFNAVKTNRPTDYTRKTREIYRSDIEDNLSLNWEWTNENKRPSMKEKQQLFESKSTIIDSKINDSKDNHSEILQSMQQANKPLSLGKRNQEFINNIGQSDHLSEQEYRDEDKLDTAQFVERIYRNEILKKTSTNQPQNERDNMDEKRNIKHNDDSSQTSSKSNNSTRSDEKMLKRKRKRHSKKKHHKHSKSRRKRESHGKRKKGLFKME